MRGVPSEAFRMASMAASGAGKLCPDIFPPLFLRHALHVEVHHQPLAQGLVDGQAQGIVQLAQAAQQDHGPVPGIHLEIKKELQVI